MRALFCILTGLLFLSCQARAQKPYKFLHFQQEHGLPSNTVYKMHKDHNGFLWFVTDMGVAIYNGNSFEKYNTYSGLPDNEIFFCQEDIEKRMWMGAFNGELSFFKDGIIYTQANTPFLRLPFKASINSLFQEKDSSLTYTFSNRKFIRIFRDQIKIFDAPYPWAQFVKQRSKGQYDIYYRDKLVTIDTMGHIIGEKEFSKDIIGNAILYTDTADLPILYSSRGLFDYNEKLIYPLKISSEQAFFIPPVRVLDGNIFLGTRNGLIVNNELLLPGTATSNVTVDRSGNYWISTLTEGVYCMFSDFRNMLEYTIDITGTVNEAKVLTGGRILFSTTSGGLYEFDKANGTTKYFGGKLKMKGLIITSGIADNGNYFMFSIAGNYTISEGGGGTKIFAQLPTPRTPKKIMLVGNRVFIFFIDEIIVFPIINGTLDLRKQPEFTLKENGRIYHRALDPATNSIWYSTNEGLNCITNNKSNFQKQLPQVNFRNFDLFGNYFLGYTEKNDIYVCNNFRDKPSVSQLRKADYILEKIYKIDSTEAIISTSEHYLHIQFRGSVTKPDFTITTIENPFIPKHVDHIFSDNDFLYFFKDNKVTKIARSILSKRVTPPKIFFSQLKCGKKIIPLEGEVKLAYKDARNISIRFNSVSDFGTEIKYEYRISSKNQNWAVLESDELNIVSLEYGTYTVSVRCKTLSGQYSNTASFTFIVDRPFWVRWWFILLIVAVVTATVLLSVRIYLKRIISRQKKKRDIEIQRQQLEFKALNALMNPHFIFNSLNNIQGLINENDKEAANRYLVVFSKVIRQNMINLTEVSIPLRKEITLVENYLRLEKLRFGEHINYEVNIDEGIDVDNIFIPPLVVQPLVENAIKHGIIKDSGNRNHILIRIKKKENDVVILVEDDGVGFFHSQKKADHVSLGIKNIKDRLAYFQRYNQQIITFEIEELTDGQNRPIGTRAVIRIKE